jgi:hypothetical protein
MNTTPDKWADLCSLMIPKTRHERHRSDYVYRGVADMIGG